MGEFIRPDGYDNIDFYMGKNKWFVETNTCKRNSYTPKCGVYLLCEEDGTIVYIGRSTRLSERVSQHRRNKNYHKSFCIEVLDATLCAELEQTLIAFVVPKYNKMIPEFMWEQSHWHWEHLYVIRRGYPMSIIPTGSDMQVHTKEQHEKYYMMAFGCVG